MWCDPKCTAPRVALLKPIVQGRRFAISGGGGIGVLSRLDFSPFLSPSRVSFSEGWRRRKGWKKQLSLAPKGGAEKDGGQASSNPAK